MKSIEELEHGWLQAPPASKTQGQVHTLCVRKGDGVHETPKKVEVTRNEGIRGDRWLHEDDPEHHRQLTLMNTTVARLIAHAATQPYEAGDNFFVDLDLSEEALPTGSRLRLGTALVEITAKPHLGCRTFHERFGPGALKWVNLEPKRHLRLRGVHARVLQDGTVAVGDTVEVVSVPNVESATSERE